jgi:DNA-binding LacI/PurR family transcriptional regulator
MPTHEIVAEGVRIAIELAQHSGASREPSVKYYEPTLVIRESTARPG